MADFEPLLISKCVQLGGIEKLIAQGVNSEHFIDEENKAVWAFVSQHLRTYRNPPSFETVKEEFPEYKWEATVEPIDFIADKFTEQVKRREAISKFREIAEILDENKSEDIVRIEEIFLDSAKELAQVIPASNVSTFAEMNQRIEAYKARKAAGLPTGMLYGYTKLDEATLGLQPHQYVTIAGWTGIGKSTLGLILAVQHYADGFTPMIVSLEMDEDEIYRKLDSIAVGLKQHALKEMILSPNEMKHWEAFAERIEDAANNIVVVDIERATPERVYAETARWNPDVVVVDYVQLMEGPRYLRSRWEQVDHCSKALKAQARNMKIPVYGLAQTNADGESEGAKLGNLGGSKAIGFHSDLVLGLHQTDDMKAMKKMEIRIEKNRSGPKDVIQSLYWDQANSVFKEWKGEYVYENK